MPCHRCYKTVSSGKRAMIRVRYCKCHACNYCHYGNICPDGKFWYKNKYSMGHRKHRYPNQSHGGHSFIPDS
jgi:hypothetical protein